MRSALLTVLLSASLALPAHADGAPALFRGGAAAADHPLASEAGAEMLRNGGNAVDAAVASAFALSVVTPYASGIGGGGFLLVALPDDPRTPAAGDAVRTAFDFRETAPAGMTADFFTERAAETARDGGLSVATPGAVAGLLRAHERFGALDRAAVLAPAIRLAEEGFVVSEDYAETAADLRGWFRANPEREQAYAALWTGFLGAGELSAGERLTNPRQAEALRLIAKEGAAAFYSGPIAEAIVETVQRSGGILTADDLAAYRVIEREPIIGEFRGRTVMAMPPPSSGGVATLQILGLIERYGAGEAVDLSAFEHNSVPYMHALAEAFKHAFADRNAMMGDADHADVPWRGLLDAAYLDQLAALTSSTSARRPDMYGGLGLAKAAIPDDAGTSHISVIDADGGAVAATLTVNTDFGSKLVVEGFGIVLNNQIDDFTTHSGRPNAFGLIQSAANAPGPGKRPVSSMAPTILFDADGAAELVVGASGGPRIISATVQAILNALVFKMTAEASVSVPRVHDQLWPPSLQLEPEWDLSTTVNPDDVEAVQRWMRTSRRNERMRFELTGLGHSLRRIEEVGAVQMVRRTPDGLDAASDPRKGGTPAGIE